MNYIEKLTINEFLGVKKATIELKDFNLLIGPQATGKSVIAKLLFYFKDIIWRVVAAAEERQTKRNLEQLLVKRFEELFPPTTWGTQSFDIHYQIGDLQVSILKDAHTKGSAKLSLDPFFHNELSRLRKISLNYHKNNQNLEDLSRAEFDLRMKLRESITKESIQNFGRNSANNQLFIPAGRSFFSNLQSNIFSFLSGNNALDPILKEFGSYYENIKRYSGTPRRLPASMKAKWDETSLLASQIICGEFITEKGKDYLNVEDGRKINLGNCSSGQQETLPLVLILRHLASLRSIRTYTLYIEEPEAHLFPTAQRKILELISLTCNLSGCKIQTIITTHSPYILTALNNLLQAGQLYEDASDKMRSALAKIVPENMKVDINNTSAYCMSKGTCVNIIDKDAGLIKTTLIDEVSTELAIQFDKLLDLESK